MSVNVGPYRGFKAVMYYSKYDGFGGTMKLRWLIDRYYDKTEHTLQYWSEEDEYWLDVPEFTRDSGIFVPTEHRYGQEGEEGRTKPEDTE